MEFGEAFASTNTVIAMLQKITSEANASLKINLDGPERTNRLPLKIS